jgi:hypothetical protein
VIVNVKRIVSGDDHDDAKWLVLEGSIDGFPQITKRRSINTAALVSGDLNVESEKAQLVSDVQEYHARYLALQAAIKDL